MDLDQLKYKNRQMPESPDNLISEQFLIGYAQQKSEYLLDRILNHIRTEHRILLVALVVFSIAGMSHLLAGDLFWIIYSFGFLGLVFFNLYLIRKLRNKIKDSYLEEQTIVAKLTAIRHILKSYIQFANISGWIFSVILIVFIMGSNVDRWLPVLQDETLGPAFFRYGPLIIMLVVYFLVMFIAYYIYNGWYRRTLLRIDSTIQKLESE